MTNQGEFVLIRSVDRLHQRGKGMAAGMWSIFVALCVVAAKDGIFKTDRVQRGIKCRAVVFDTERAAVRRAKDRAADLIARQIVNDVLNLWRDGNDAICASLCLGAAGKGFFFAVILLYIER